MYNLNFSSSLTFNKLEDIAEFLSTQDKPITVEEVNQSLNNPDYYIENAQASDYIMGGIKVAKVTKKQHNAMVNLIDEFESRFLFTPADEAIESFFPDELDDFKQTLEYELLTSKDDVPIGIYDFVTQIWFADINEVKSMFNIDEVTPMTELSDKDNIPHLFIPVTFQKMFAIHNLWAIYWEELLEI